MSNLVKYRLVEDRPRTGLARMVDAVRGIFLGPYGLKDKELVRLLGGAPTATGISVDEWNVLAYSAIWACVTLIADDIASLPLMLFKRLAGGGKERFEDHSLFKLLHDAPNDEMSTMDWRRTMQGHVLIWGNGYSEIERDQADRPRALWPITPDRVTPVRRSPMGVLEYKVLNANNREIFLPARDVLHIRGLSFDGVSGYRALEKMRESISLALAAERFGGEFFGNGSTFGGVISYPDNPKDEVRKQNREVLERRHKGVDNAHKFLALYGGAKYETLGVKPNEGQFNELRTFQIREAARWFKVPPHMLADLADATFSNVEQQKIDYYTSCLRPWLEVWEQELSRKLISPLERRQQVIEHVPNDLLRADSKARGEFYSTRFNVGSLTPNEIRAFENQNPLPGGDRSFVPLNMIAADRYDEWLDADIASKKPKPTPAPAPPTADQVNAFIAALEARILERDTMILTEVAAKTAAETEADTYRRESEALRTELQEARAALEVATVDNGLLKGFIAEFNETKATYVAEADARVEVADERAQIAEAVTAELREHVKDAGEIREVLAKSEAEKANLLEAKVALEVDAREKVTEILTLQDRILDMTAAVREVLVDKVQGILQREIDRARKAQATPEKLAKWIETFYPLHDEFCRTMLAPAVRAWLACAGLPEDDERLGRWIARHLDESQQQLRLVTQEPDPDAYAAALERVLRRWETERADRTVDRWVKEQAA